MLMQRLQPHIAFRAAGSKLFAHTRLFAVGVWAVVR